jgi:signal transduction histidine kinase
LISFQYSSYTSAEIVKVAAQNVQSNAKIQVHDIERILVNRIDAIATNLHIITNIPSVRNGEFERERQAFNAAQDSTSELTDFFMWLDRDGRMVWLSNINQTAYKTFRGTDLSYRDYFTETKNRLETYYSSAIDSNDNVVRIYIAQPIINEQGAFEGAAVAAIRLDTLGTFLENELSPNTQRSVGILDRNGMILYAGDQGLTGKDIFGPEFQSILPPQLKDSFNEFVRQSVEGREGIGDLTFGNFTATIAYEPILIEGGQFGTLYIMTPHEFADNVSLLVDQERNLSTLISAAIGAVAVGIGVLIVVWNRRLERTVSSRTSELRAKSEELKRSYDSLAAANQQLKVHDRLQKEFINVAAHELRTPTQAILGYAELLQMDPEDRQEMIRAIYRNSIRLQRLTSYILDVTRIESESLRLDRETFNLKDVIQGAIQDAKNQLANGQIKFAYEPKDITVDADRGRITQVVSNLLDNAVKFTKEGTIMVSTEVKNGGGSSNIAVVSVKDTGSGIDPEIMPRLFSKFVTKSNRGTGLGLFISKSIVEAHGGRIWCANNSDGRGAMFAFSLPAAAAN